MRADKRRHSHVIKACVPVVGGWLVTTYWDWTLMVPNDMCSVEPRPARSAGAPNPAHWGEYITVWSTGFDDVRGIEIGGRVYRWDAPA